MQKDPTNLLNLRNLMKRDPGAYYEEFKQQYRHFEANLQIFKLKESKGKDSEKFAELVEFLSHVTPSFPEESKTFPGQLLDLLANNYEALDPNLRRTLAQCLILLSNRLPEHLSRIQLLPVFFTLFRCPDKVLRQMLFSYVVNDIKRLNKKTQNIKLNTSLQNFMFTMLKDSPNAASEASSSASSGVASSQHQKMAAKKALQVMIELWRRKVWRDERTVNCIANACFYKDTAVLSIALRFFLGVEDYDDEKEREKEEEMMHTQQDFKKLSATFKISKDKTKRKRDIKRAAAKLKKVDKEDKGSSVHAALNLPAIHLVYDPQKFAERL